MPYNGNYANITLTRRIQIFFLCKRDEHEPKHIHVVKGGNFAKIELTLLEAI